MKEYITLTQLGKIYGVAARDVGGWLKGLGLRQENGWPSREAISRGFVRDRILPNGATFWLWEKERTCHELDMMGYIRAGDEIEQHDGFILIRGSKGRR